MAAINVGRICVKLRGREKGLKCIVVDEIDEKYVVITGPKELTGIRRRRVNVRHIHPTDKTVKIKRGASDKEVMAALRRSKLLEFVQSREE
ncbi:50S ribosomal protein L14e [Candidatus Bathyarchaeota archaeon ex4484_205]|nr:MAG: 50S ribosomal protein L14e [Candidatus Bathyarchaeota archaeon ex4484_205]RLG68766.1 MAG: 50S ribosomal protein L14e [archaeon]